MPTLLSITGGNKNDEVAAEILVSSVKVSAYRKVDFSVVMHSIGTHRRISSVVGYLFRNPDIVSSIITPAATFSAENL